MCFQIIPFISFYLDFCFVYRVSLYFGIITCVAGFLGVLLGSGSAGRLRKTCPRADPLVCAFGLITSAPFLFLVLYVAKYNTIATWVSTHSYLMLHLF